jgi:hypothetical protein
VNGSTLAAAVRTATELERWGSARGWVGSDPYEGLNATRIVTPLHRSSLGRRAVTQLVKRSPVDLRPILGIRPEPDAAAIAHIVSSYARNGFLPDDEAAAKLAAAVALLDRLRFIAFGKPCWGYHFDVQTRVFFYARGTPNAIASSFAGTALLDAHDATGDAQLLRQAEGVGDFLLRGVPQTADDGGAYFGYLPGDRTPIHNANMLAGALLARLARILTREDFAAAAREATGYTVAHQRPEGWWPYAERRGLEWVDGFHTGYVLESLQTCAEAGIEEAVPALDRGLAFYSRALFLADGTPRYTTTSTYPVDAQCVAQGIQTFARAAARDRGHLDDARRVFAYALARMRRTDGAFAFQRRRLWVNRTPHVRWSAAPMLLAITHLIEAEERA